MIVIAETIRGINVQIGSDTTGLSKALGDVNKKSRDIQSELRKVERLLKFDPKNTELLAQRQRLLSEAIANSGEKLNRLRDAQEQVNEQFRKGEISEGQYRAFQREVVKAEQELKRFKKRTESTKRSLSDLANSVSETGEKLKGIGQNLSMSITAPVAGFVALATEGTKELRTELAKLETNTEQAGANMNNMNEAMRQMAAVTGETDSNVEGLSNLLAAGFKGDQFKAVLDELAGASIKFKDTLKFEGIADGLQETLAVGEAVGPFAELLERLGINLDDFNAGLQKAKKNGEEQNYALKVLQEQGLAGVYESYRKNNEALVESEEANYKMQESLAKLGETLQPIVTKVVQFGTKLLEKFNELDPGIQQLILAFSGLATVIGPIVIVISAVISAVGTILPLFGTLASAAGAVGAALAALSGPIGIAIGAIVALIAAGVAIYKNWDAIKEKTIEIWDKITDSLEKIWDGIKKTATKVWDSIKDFFKSWGDEILLIAAGPAGWAVLLGRKLAENWDSIKQIALNVWNNIKTGLASIWSNITSATSNAVSNLYDTVRSKLEGLWNYIKGIPGQALSWGRDIIQGLINGIRSLHIPMPHFDFSVNWREVGGVNFPVPDVDVDWYKTGGIFTSPTIAGIGDVPEAVVPLDRLTPMLTDALSKAVSSLKSNQLFTGAGGDIIIQKMYVRDDNDIRQVSRELYNLQVNAGRAAGRR